MGVFGKMKNKVDDGNSINNRDFLDMMDQEAYEAIMNEGPSYRYCEEEEYCEYSNKLVYKNAKRGGGIARKKEFRDTFQQKKKRAEKAATIEYKNKLRSLDKFSQEIN